MAPDPRVDSTTITHPPSGGRNAGTRDGHLLGPGWVVATVVAVVLISFHPIRRWRARRRGEVSDR